MEIKKRTPRTDLQLGGILYRLGDLIDPLTEELGTVKYMVDEALTSYARISVRASFDKDEVDFDLIQPGDGIEQMRAKFEKYLDTQCAGVIEAALMAISEMDSPIDPATAPTPLEGAEGK